MSAHATVQAGSSAEVQAAAFADDPRIYFSKETGTWRLEEDDGTELEYDASKAAWIPLVAEDLMKAQQAAYSIAGVDEEVPAAPVLARANKKRKEPEDYTSATAISEAGPSIKRTKGDKKEKPPTERKSKNTAVYVTGLPTDTDADELVERFSKCGVIEEDDEGEPKVKMYARDDGTFSGEALVVYFKEDSVLLAESLLDDAELRLGDNSTTMQVRKADFSRKATPNTAGGEGGGDGAAATGEPKPRKTMDKKKTSRRIGKMQKKLLEWDDEDGFGPATAPEDAAENTAVNKNSRVVVLKYMFTLEELEKDASLILDLKEDVREECSTLGEVTNIVLYDREPDGIMTVKFREPLGAQACVLRMNGRFFDGRKVEAAIYTGKNRFRQSGRADEGDETEAAAEAQRLEAFSAWLLTEGD